MQTGLTFHIGCGQMLIDTLSSFGHRYLGITSRLLPSGSRNAKRYAVCLELVYAMAPVNPTVVCLGAIHH